MIIASNSKINRPFHESNIRTAIGYLIDVSMYKILKKFEWFTPHGL